MSQFSVPLSSIANSLNLEIVSAPTDLEDIYIETAEVNRPGLLLAGYSEFFQSNRVQILGKAEMGFLSLMAEDERRKSLHALFKAKPPTVVLTRSAEPYQEIREFARQYEVPVFSTAETTSMFMNSVISILTVELAPRVTRHGVLVEVYGEGILILGESGVGKSETAVELIKRGHRLIADDAVELRRVSNRTIVGQAPENIRYFIELRGIGIVNVAKIFGAGAVKKSEKVDLVAELEPWDKKKNYSRTGLERNTMDIMGVEVPMILIPVMPGRNLAIIMEIAAINNRQKALGYNAAQDLLRHMGLNDDISGEASRVTME